MSDLEVIVVDDASTDETSVAIESIADKRLRYFRRDSRGGGSAARNTGIEHARGTVLAFLDSDDEWEPHKLSRQLAELDRSGGRALVMCGFVRVLGRTQRRAVPAAMNNTNAFDRLLELRGGPMSSSLFLVSQSALSDAGVRFDPALPALQDLDFALQLARSGFSIVGPSEVLVRKYRDNARDHVFNPSNEITARRQVLDKYRDELINHPVALIQQRRLLATALLRSGSHTEAQELLRLNAASQHARRSDRLSARASGLGAQHALRVEWARRQLEGATEGKLLTRVGDLGRDALRSGRTS